VNSDACACRSKLCNLLCAVSVKPRCQGFCNSNLNWIPFLLFMQALPIDLSDGGPKSRDELRRRGLLYLSPLTSQIKRREPCSREARFGVPKTLMPKIDGGRFCSSCSASKSHLELIPVQPRFHAGYGNVKEVLHVKAHGT
jgi:hypothetical protein